MGYVAYSVSYDDVAESESGDHFLNEDEQDLVENVISHTVEDIGLSSAKSQGDYSIFNILSHSNSCITMYMYRVTPPTE